MMSKLSRLSISCAAIFLQPIDLAMEKVSTRDTLSTQQLYDTRSDSGSSSLIQYRAEPHFSHANERNPTK
jgi:hypothetical protein